jgi:DNA-binding transcriptional regulator YhcF (GntR family)
LVQTGATALASADVAESNGDRGQSALTQLRAWLAQRELPPSTRLPPERELSELLGVSRGELRKALAILEEHGELWRHVGKGTFIGARPVAELSSIAEVAAQTSPSEVMRARLAIEPELAREAALHATADDIAEMKLCVSGARGAETWRQYEHTTRCFSPSSTPSMRCAAPSCGGAFATRPPILRPTITASPSTLRSSRRSRNATSRPPRSACGSILRQCRRCF